MSFFACAAFVVFAFTVCSHHSASIIFTPVRHVRYNVAYVHATKFVAVDVSQSYEVPVHRVFPLRGSFLSIDSEPCTYSARV